MDPEEILKLLDQQDMTQSELARRIGLEQNKLNKSLNGKRRITADEMDKIREVLFEGVSRFPIRTIPVIGQISAGNWREAVEHPIGTMPIPDPSLPPKAFGLRVTGDSMDILVDDGAMIIVDPDDYHLHDGKYYAILNGEGEATFKQFKSNPARLVPCSTNPAYKEIMLSGEPFEVIGRIIWRASRM